jgi:2-polyprenyl-6-hydroxyphenyl methylase/3-demethylubiquinone-9 3-methyltransferase
VSYVAPYCWPPVLRALREHGARDVLDVGCGDGGLVDRLREEGFEAQGVDVEPSRETAFVRRGSAYEPLDGPYDAVVAVEVVEHLLDPRLAVRRMREALRPGGLLVLTTPFHGYWKNLALALTGKMDAHFTALWDGGHVKFWSPRTIRTLLAEAGYADVSVRGAGRFPPLWASMVVTATVPPASPA